MSHNYWRENALTMIKNLQGGYHYTGEEIRSLIGFHLGPPKHPNCWGALVRTAVKRGWLIDTGNTTHMDSEKSHGRRTPIWMKKGGSGDRIGAQAS